MTQKFSHLSQKQRYKIEALKNAGFSQTKIANQIGIHRSTICRELKRNAISRAKSPGKYKAGQAQNFAEKRAIAPRVMKQKMK